MILINEKGLDTCNHLARWVFMLLILLSSDAGQFVIVSWFKGHEEGSYFARFFVIIIIICFSLCLLLLGGLLEVAAFT